MLCILYSICMQVEVLCEPCGNLAYKKIFSYSDTKGNTFQRRIVEMQYWSVCHKLSFVYIAINKSNSESWGTRRTHVMQSISLRKMQRGTATITWLLIKRSGPNRLLRQLTESRWPNERGRRRESPNALSKCGIRTTAQSPSLREANVARFQGGHLTRTKLIRMQS